MELFHAANQWATRPADERFSTLEEMYAVTKGYADQAREKTVNWADLRVEAQGQDLHLVGRTGVPATVTNYAFGQIANRVGAPAGYLRTLAPTLAAQNLNYGLANKSTDGAQAALMFHQNGGLLLRAATSEIYSRIWNWEVIARLMDLSARHNLVPAQQTFSWDGSGVPEDAPKALYASDHDMFAFLMSPDATVTDPVGQMLRRGVIAVNSEVGDKSLKFMGFYFRDVCANHIIWGARELAEVSLRHVGAIRQNMLNALVTVRRYMDGAASLDQAKFSQVTMRIADDKDKVLDRLFGIRSLGLSRKVLAASYDAVVPEEDGSPNTVWGFAQGVTRHSQTLPYADDRTQLDRAAGKVLAFDF
jgi:hypothetical protein